MSSKEVGIEEARKRLGPLVTAAQQGTDIILTRNGKPVARIAPMEVDMFVVYSDATGANQIEQCGKARWQEIAESPDTRILCVTEIEDVARRAKGVEPQDLGDGIRLSGRIRQDTPPGPEHDRFEYLVDYRPPHATETETLRVWAQGSDDLPREIRLAVEARGPRTVW